MRKMSKDFVLYLNFCFALKANVSVPYLNPLVCVSSWPKFKAFLSENLCYDVFLVFFFNYFFCLKCFLIHSGIFTYHIIKFSDCFYISVILFGPDNMLCFFFYAIVFSHSDVKVEFQEQFLGVAN